MFGLPLAFGAPLALTALLALPVIWYLLRLTPPKPQQEIFPPTQILATLMKREETPAQSPWWLTLLRLSLAALAILAMSLPMWNPEEATLTGDGPITLIIDDGWASGGDWDARKQSASKIIAEARDGDRLVTIIRTTAPVAKSENAEEALKIMDGLTNIAAKPDHLATAKVVANLSNPGTLIFFSDGLAREGTPELASAIDSANTSVGSQKFLFQSKTNTLLAMTNLSNNPDALRGQITRANPTNARTIDLTAYDIKGIPIARQTVQFASGNKQVEFQLTEPVELRNEITKISINQVDNAGAVQLLDESNRRRLVGVISGEKRDLSQPLLSPLYYITRALEPFSDIREANNANVALAVPDLINQGVSAIVLADVGLIPEATVDEFQEWIEKGGMLVRFAGPRMAASREETLLPVRIRRGDRNLGSALSWEAPKPVAAFEPSSPFFGLQAPKEVLVTRQVLALQELSLEGKTWASLEDGTPLVTAEQRGNGWIVLFHVSSDATWSNLPISGTFVEMLRRVVNQSKSNGGALNPEKDLRLPPLNILDGQGKFSAPSAMVQPLVLSKGIVPKTSVENPPGFYGTEDGFTALNLFSKDDELTPLNAEIFISDMIRSAYQSQQAIELKPWLLLGAALLLFLDCLAVLWISGALKLRPSAQLARAMIFAIAGLGSVLASTADLRAQQSVTDFASTLKTRLAYVITGDTEVDSKSQAGLAGLTRFLATRTALEPGDPIGLDIAVDELAFYSLIYWPVRPESPLPTAKTMARIDAFMKQGGSILFDTQDQISGSFGGTASSPAARQLQAILSVLDIPPLEPVPSDHVLTKSFYLLDSFPGRYAGGELWVEAFTGASALANGAARSGDGVSSILITSNDMAGAWAMDATGRPLYSTVPPDPVQRTYAFRVGVNLMMYTLTGNYKSDQVHIPALLERLGQ